MRNACRECRPDRKYRFVPALVVGIRIIAPNGKRCNAGFYVLDLQILDIISKRFPSRRILHFAIEQRDVARRTCRIATQLIRVPALVGDHILDRDILYLRMDNRKV